MRDPASYTAEIREWQLAHGDGFVVGGRHTSHAIKRIQKRLKEKTPSNFREWPTKALLLPGHWTEYVDELLALGVMDNENLHLETHWHDMLEKVRDLFEYIFEKNPYSSGSNEQKARLKQVITTICKCAVNTAGTWRAVATRSEPVWNYFRQLYLGTYIQAEKLPTALGAVNKSGKRGRPAGKVGQAKGCKLSDLVAFSGIDDDVLLPILKNVVEGKLSLKAALNDAMDNKAFSKMRREFNEYMKKKGISYEEDGKKKIYDYQKWCSESTPQAVGKFELLNLSRFKMKKGRLPAIQLDEFHKSIDQAIKQQVEQVSDVFQTHRSLSLIELLTPAARKIFKESDSDPISLISSTSSSILCLRADTRDLANYLDEKFLNQLPIGTQFSLFLFSPSSVTTSSILFP